jgi:hypothetical protein
VNSTSQSLHKLQVGEMLLLAGSVLSLLASCVLWSPHKQPWMDEIFTWKEATDRSLWHLYYAIQHGADGGQPLFYTTAWLWAKIFGGGALTLFLGHIGGATRTECGSALLRALPLVRRDYR